MTFAKRRNRLTTHFSERIPVVKRSISVFWYECIRHLRSCSKKANMALHAPRFSDINSQFV